MELKTVLVLVANDIVDEEQVLLFLVNLVGILDVLEPVPEAVGVIIIVDILEEERVLSKLQFGVWAGGVVEVGEEGDVGVVAVDADQVPDSQHVGDARRNVAGTNPPKNGQLPGKGQLPYL